MTPEEYEKRNDNGFYAYIINNGEISRKPKPIVIDVDYVNEHGNNANLEKFVREQEILAVTEQRFEDACKWRDFPKAGRVEVERKNDFWIIK
jgi:hypothetical protein